MEVIRKLHCGLRAAILLAAVAAFAIAAFIQHPIPQPLSYHRFADHRTLLGIPNFLDVVSNLAFLYIGITGLWFLFRQTREATFVDARERWPYAVLFAGMILTCFGSMYYHLLPNNARLVWDRVPMTLIFAAILAAIVAERVNLRLGLALLGPLMAVGIWSVLQWKMSELRGEGDLRLYLMVQLLPAFVVPILMALFPARYTRGTDLGVVLLLYVLSKIFELFDREIYRAGHVLSGHTLKHVVSALAIYWVLRMLKRRKALVAAAPYKVGDFAASAAEGAGKELRNQNLISSSLSNPSCAVGAEQEHGEWNPS
jgi:predicted membrane channel-forming protein YqfA (hemolysin III family)